MSEPYKHPVLASIKGQNAVLESEHPAVLSSREHCPPRRHGCSFFTLDLDDALTGKAPTQACSGLTPPYLWVSNSFPPILVSIMSPFSSHSWLICPCLFISHIIWFHAQVPKRWGQWLSPPCSLLEQCPAHSWLGHCVLLLWIGEWDSSRMWDSRWQWSKCFLPQVRSISSRMKRHSFLKYVGKSTGRYLL